MNNGTSEFSKFEINDLEEMIDNHGLEKLVEAISIICMRKSNSEAVRGAATRAVLWASASQFFAKIRVPITFRS